MMERVLRLLGAAVLAGLLLWPPQARAQALRTYADPICGVSFQYPEFLNARRLDTGVATVVTGGFGGAVDLVQDVTADQTADLAASAAAARYCLDCLREPQDRLVWMDRFREGTTAVRYIIFKETLEQFTNDRGGGNTPGFRVHYFVVADGRTRGLPEGSTSRLEAYFWVAAAQFAQGEPVAREIVRSLRLSPPQGQCRR